MHRGPSRKRAKKKQKLIDWQTKREVEKQRTQLPNRSDPFIPQSTSLLNDDGSDVQDHGEATDTAEETTKDVSMSEEEGPMKVSTKWGAAFDKILNELGLVEHEMVERVRARLYASFVTSLKEVGMVEDDMDEYTLAQYWEHQKRYLKFELDDESYAKWSEYVSSYEEEADYTVEEEADYTVEEEEEADNEYEKEGKDYGYMCTIVSDFLCGLESVAGHGPKYDKKIRSKALAAFKQCYTNGVWTSSELSDRDDTVGIDLRGRYVADAERMLAMSLYSLSREPNIKRLLVSVGCMKHGCGEGKLKNAITEMLKRDETIPVKYLDEDGSTISIELDRMDYNTIGWILHDYKPGEKSYCKEIIKGDVKDYGPLCTIFCDFLCDLDTTKSYLLFDHQISHKVLSGFQKCHKDELQNLEKGTVLLDIRGDYVTVALEILMLHLFCFSGREDVKKVFVRVGCQVHGCGEGNLKNAVIDLLRRDKEMPIQYKFVEVDSTICITLDRTDYSGIGWTREDLMKSRIFQLYN